MIVTGGNVVIRWHPGWSEFVVESYAQVDGPFIQLVDVDRFAVEV